MRYVFIISCFILSQTAFGQDIKNAGDNYMMVLRPMGHKGIIWDLSISSDEKYIITAGQDKTVKFWDIENGLEERGEVLGHIGNDIYGAVYAARVSPNGKWLATTGYFGDVDAQKYTCDIRIYDMATKVIVHVFSHHLDVMSALRWSRDSRYLISASKDHAIGIWDMESFSLKTELKGHGDQVLCADIFADHVVSSSKDNLIMLWDVNTGNSIMTSFDHFGSVSQVIFDPSGQYIISASHDNTIKIFNKDLTLINSIATENPASAMSFSIDKNYLLVGFDDGTVKVFQFSLGTLTEVASYKPHTGGFVAGIVMTKDKKIISAGGTDSNVSVYELKDGKAVFSLEPVQSTQKVWSAGLDDEVMAFSTGSSNRISITRDIEFSKGFNFVSRDYKDLDKYNYLMTLTMGQGISDRTAKFNGCLYHYKAPIFRMGALKGELLDNKVVVTYAPLGEDESWTEQKGNFTGYKYGDIVTQIYNRYKKYGFTFTPDSLVIIAGSAGYLKAFDLSGKMVTDFIGHEDVVFTINMSTDRKWIISGSFDHSIRFWDTEKVGKQSVLKPAATCYFSQFGDWIVATDQGYYMSSNRGGKYIGFHQNKGYQKEAKYYPFENFDLKYNRPDKVLERLDMGSESLRNILKQAYQKRLQKMDIKEEVLSDELSLPEVTINTVAQAVMTKSFILKIKATDEKFELDRLNVFVNDVPIYGSKGVNVKNFKNKQSIEVTLEIELLPGKNKIQVSALNKVGVESLKETVIVHYDGKPIKPDLHIVTIGVSKYNDSNYDLDYASKDATDVANLFQSHNELYNKIYIHRFTDALAQREQILTVKEKLNQTQVNDEVIIFAAGHGLLDEKLDYYFATHDIDFNNPVERGLKYEELEGLLDGIPARKKLLLIDACHSGEVDKDEIKLVKTMLEGNAVKTRGFTKKPQPLGIDNVFELMNELFTDLRRGTGAMVISSAAGMEFALESETWQNGVFTYALKEALITKKGDANGDSQIQISELRNFVFDRVTELTNGKQHPTSRRENLEFDFRVW